MLRTKSELSRSDDAALRLFRASRSKRRSKLLGHRSRSSGRLPAIRCVTPCLLGHRQQLRLRLRKSRYWRGLPGLRGPVAVALVVAQQAFRQATVLGSDVPRLVGPLIPKLAETDATTKPTSNARRLVIFSVGNPWKSIGIAPASRLKSKRTCLELARPGSRAGKRTSRGTYSGEPRNHLWSGPHVQS